MNKINPKIANRRGGYTVIIVLMVLSILSILVMTLSYTSRLEMSSAANYSSGIQARTAAITGVSFIPGKLGPLNSVDAPLKAINRNFWIAPRTTDLSQSGISLHSTSGRANPQMWPVPPVSDIYASDTSSRLNLNGATEEQLIRLFEEVLPKAKISTGRARNLAKALAEWRLGPDGRAGRAGVDDDLDSGISQGPVTTIRKSTFGYSQTRIASATPESTLAPPNNEPVNDGFDNDNDGTIDEVGELIDEPDEYIVDVRRSAYGDDKRVFLLTDLHYVPGFSPEVIKVLAPYVTVFSESMDIYLSQKGDELARINCNYSPLSTLIDMLEEHYPDKDPSLLTQFALNMVDYRDADGVPTMLRNSDKRGPSTLFGVEVTPFINEVWPDSTSDDDDEGDDGQYVEIFNPWPVALSVDNWRLRTTGSEVILRGSIVPGGYVIVTDDFDDSNDTSPEDDEEIQFGSFYTIFGVVPNGRNRKMVEVVSFELLNDQDTVELVDETGRLIDAFDYKTEGTEQYRYSWQREDPRLRTSRLETCSPYMINKGYVSGADDFETLDERRDRLFHSSAHVLNVYSGFVAYQERFEGTPVQWQYPSFWNDSDKNNLSLTLLDVFTIDTDLPRQVVSDGNAIAQAAQAASYGPGNSSGIDNLLGRLNVNTLSPEMLEIMFNIDRDGLMQSATELMVEDDTANDTPFAYTSTRIAGASTSTRRKTEQVVFNNYSNFFEAVLSKQIGENPEREKLIDVISTIMPQITFNSLSYSVISQNRMILDEEHQRQQAKSLIQAVVVLGDKGDMQLINWQFLH